MFQTGGGWCPSAGFQSLSVTCVYEQHPGDAALVFSASNSYLLKTSSHSFSQCLQPQQSSPNSYRGEHKRKLVLRDQISMCGWDGDTLTIESIRGGCWQVVCADSCNIPPPLPQGLAAHRLSGGGAKLWAETTRQNYVGANLLYFPSFTVRNLFGRQIKSPILFKFIEHFIQNEEK